MYRAVPLVGLLSTLSVGCFSAPVHGLRLTRAVEPVTGLTDGDFSQVHSDAVAVLGSAKRVAIKPPSLCVDEAARADQQGQGIRRDVAEQCGVVIASVERALFKLGFDVVSWQRLRDGTLDQASVDLVLELNELSTKDYQTRAGSAVDASFFTVEDGAELPLTLQADSPAIGRCRAIVDAAAQQQQAGRLTATLNLKLVRPTDGAVLWFYQRTVVDEAPDHSAQGPSEYRYQSRNDGQLSRGGTFGVGLLAAGVGVALLSSLPTLEGEDGESEEPSGEFALQVGLGLVALVTGTIYVVNSASMDQDTAASPDRVLCQRQLTVSDDPDPAPERAPAGVSSLSSRKAQTVSGKNRGEVARRRIRQAVVDSMAKTLVSIRSGDHR